MHRRLAVVALACSPLARAFAQDEPPRPHVRIPASELAEALAARFPVRLAVPGLFELEIDAPGLLLLPASQQLGATLQARASSPQTQQVERGEMDVAFRLRYEASDRTLRAHHLQVLDVRWPGLDPQTTQLLQGLVPDLARENVGEIVLHRFSARELALPDTMGFQPDRITITGDGLVITFGPKPLR